MGMVVEMRCRIELERVEGEFRAEMGLVWP